MHAPRKVDVIFCLCFSSSCIARNPQLSGNQILIIRTINEDKHVKLTFSSAADDNIENVNYYLHKQ